MENLSLEKLAGWADGRACGTTISALGSYLSLGVTRDLLELRRTNSGAYATPPVVDLKQWLAFYQSPKSVEAPVVRIICGEDGDEVLRLIAAIRNPKAADEEARLLLFGLILGFFQKLEGPQLDEFLSILLQSDDEGGEEALNDPAFQFAIRVDLPCWLVYGRRPYKLLRVVSGGGELAEEAARCLVRLDHQVVAHPVIQRWIHSDSRLAPFKLDKIEKWRRQRPFDAARNQSAVLRMMAGHVANLSDLVDDPLDVRDHRALLEALGDAIPADLRNYVDEKTNDDLSREIRRHRDHFEVPERPDKSKYELVRGILKGLE